MNEASYSFKKQSKFIIRFALWNRKKCLLKILNASNNYKTSAIDTDIIELKNKYFYRHWESGIADFYNNRFLLQADGGVYEINRYEETDKEIKTNLLSTINIKIQNTEYKNMAIIRIITYFFISFTDLLKICEPGEGCRRAKLNYFTDCLENKGK